MDFFTICFLCIIDAFIFNKGTGTKEETMKEMRYAIITFGGVKIARAKKIIFPNVDKHVKVVTIGKIEIFED